MNNEFCRKCKTSFDSDYQRCNCEESKSTLVLDSNVDESLWKAGDIVTRDGTDEHRIISIDSDLIEVICIKAPSCPWTIVGEIEMNLTRRYSWVRTGS